MEGINLVTRRAPLASAPHHAMASRMVVTGTRRTASDGPDRRLSIGHIPDACAKTVRIRRFKRLYAPLWPVGLPPAPVCLIPVSPPDGQPTGAVSAMPLFRLNDSYQAASFGCPVRQASAAKRKSR